MAGKSSPIKGICGCLLCLCSIIVLVAIIGFMAGFGTVLVMLRDYQACDAIAKKEQYMVRIENVTAQKGSEVEVPCQILNYEYVEKVTWTSSRFNAELEPLYLKPTVLKAQYGLDVTGNVTEGIFLCAAHPAINATFVGKILKTFTLIFNPVDTDHDGWYSCVSGNMGKKFYLSVE